MKLKITDLLDSYQDTTVDITAADRKGLSAETEPHTILAVRETKRRFQWKTVAGLAAALAVLVGATALLVPKLRGTSKMAAQGTDQATELQSALPNTTDAQPDPTAASEPSTDAPQLGLYKLQLLPDGPGVEGEQPCFRLMQDDNGANLFLYGSRMKDPFLDSSFRDWGRWTYADGVLTVQDNLGGAYRFSVSQDGDLTCISIDKPGTSSHLLCPMGSVFTPVEELEWNTADMVGCYLKDSATVSVYASGAALVSDGDEAPAQLFGRWSLEGRVLTIKDQKGACVFGISDNGSLVYLAGLSEELTTASNPFPFQDGDVFKRQSLDMDPEDPNADDPAPEYPVRQAVPANGAPSYDSVFVPRTGDLRTYLYTALPAAADYVDILKAYTAETFGIAADELERRESDAYDDGYANNSLTAPENGSATICGNYQTGRFTYFRSPTDDEIHNELTVLDADPETLEPAARAFIDRFAAVTGPLKMVEMKVEDQSYLDSDSHNWIHAPVVIFCYVAEQGHGALEAQNGFSVPIHCTNGDCSDPNAACFSVTVGMNGKVLAADNCVTQAEAEWASWKEVPTEDNIPGILSYVYSPVENDTMILHRVEVTEYSVYFGDTEILPLITVTYSLASSPDELQTMEIVLDAPLEP